jgi:hypothetical protein
MAADASEIESLSNASTFEARVLSSTSEADIVEEAIRASSTRLRYQLAAVVGIAAGAILAIAIVAFRPREADPASGASHGGDSVPVVRALPEQAPTRAVAPAPPAQPSSSPNTHVEHRAAEAVEERPAPPTPAGPAAPPPGAVLAGHKGVAASVKKLEEVRAQRGGTLQPHAEDPFAAAIAPDRSDPFQTDKPTVAKKPAVREPSYADPFEHDDATVEAPAIPKQARYVDPFESDEPAPKPSPRAKQ